MALADGEDGKDVAEEEDYGREKRLGDDRCEERVGLETWRC